VKCPKCKKIGDITAETAMFNESVESLNFSNKKRAPRKTSMLSVRPFLEVLDNNETVQNVIASGWRISVIVLSIAAVLSWFIGFTVIPTLAISGIAVFAVCQIGLLVALVVSIQILWLRGDDISVNTSGKFVVVPIIAHLLKAVTEAAGAYLAIASIPFALMIAVVGVSPSIMGPKVSAVGSGVIEVLLGVVSLLVVTWATAIILVLWGRLVSDLLNATFSIANDISAIANGKGTVRE